MPLTMGVTSSHGDAHRNLLCLSWKKYPQSLAMLGNGENEHKKKKGVPLFGPRNVGKFTPFSKLRWFTNYSWVNAECNCAVGHSYV